MFEPRSQAVGGGGGGRIEGQEPTTQRQPQQEQPDQQREIQQEIRWVGDQRLMGGYCGRAPAAAEPPVQCNAGAAAEAEAGLAAKQATPPRPPLFAPRARVIRIGPKARYPRGGLAPSGDAPQVGGVSRRGAGPEAQAA